MLWCLFKIGCLNQNCSHGWTTIAVTTPKWVVACSNSFMLSWSRLAAATTHTNVESIWVCQAGRGARTNREQIPSVLHCPQCTHLLVEVYMCICDALCETSVPRVKTNMNNTPPPTKKKSNLFENVLKSLVLFSFLLGPKCAFWMQLLWMQIYVKQDHTGVKYFIIGWCDKHLFLNVFQLMPNNFKCSSCLKTSTCCCFINKTKTCWWKITTGHSVGLHIILTHQEGHRPRNRKLKMRKVMTYISPSTLKSDVCVCWLPI